MEYDDTCTYVNAIELQTNERRFQTESSKSEVNLDEKNLDYYETLRYVTRQGESRNKEEEKKDKSIKWKDQPREIKTIIYALSLLLVILYIIVVIATVVIVLSLPKSEAEGTWTLWSAWSNCDVTCANGTQTRFRQCYSPSVSTEQFDCKGSSMESLKCQQSPCFDDGTWTLWSAWSNCDVTCDNGTKTRFRLCYNPSVPTKLLDCEGTSTESMQCQQTPCNNNGTWTLWSAWSNCDVTCDNGTKTRFRLCYNSSVPTKLLDCEGTSTESMQCQQTPCINNGTWTLWSEWSNCDVTCDNGTKTRFRLCYNPSVPTKLLDCEGTSTESMQCQQTPCINNGTWTLWSVWSNCDVTCDNDTKTRFRLCYNPSFPTKLTDCEGTSTESMQCQQTPCNNNGTWTLWSEWSNCDVTCDNGTKTRFRLCYNPSVPTKLLDCEGTSTESMQCQQTPCINNGTWTLWSVWSNCDVTCDNDTKTRFRLCYNPSFPTKLTDCEGTSTESMQCQQTPCNNNGTWTLWSAWSNCDVTCDNGTKTRFRLCNNPSVPTKLIDCEGTSTESMQCQQTPCIRGAWSNWGSWGSCSERCGGGVKSRLRTCTNPRPSTLEKWCDGSSDQVVLCNKQTCNDHKVSFLAYGSTTVTSSSVLKFPTISFNSGNGYSSSTGRFTCKIPGIYNFAVTLTKPRRDIDQINAYLQINGLNKLRLYTDPDDHDNIDYGSYSLSVTGNFHLNTNDYVYVYATPIYLINDYSTSFTGVLVIPD